MSTRTFCGGCGKEATGDSTPDPRTGVPRHRGRCPVHYVYGSGSVGCMYDCGPHFTNRRQEAAEFFVDMFADSISEEEADALKSDLATRGIHYFTDAAEAGADYCEVSEQAGPCPEDDS